MAPLPSRHQLSAASNHQKQTGGTKRKRPPSDQQHGIDLPQIPGIPIEILPLHVQAVKVCSAFVRRYADKEVLALPHRVENTQRDDDGLFENTERASNLRRDAAPACSVLDTLFHRIEHGAAQAESQTDTGRDRRESLQQKDQALTSWLQAIHRWLRDNNRHRSSQEQQKGFASRDGVPLAVLQHLLKVAVEHRKIHVKRAATHMMGHLLYKSSGCRRWFFEETEDNMLAWIDAVCSFKEAESSAVRLLQRESYLLLQLLNYEFGDLYPTSIVALQRFQQLCPTACETESLHDCAVATYSTVERRKIRDVAMMHAETEERRVKKLIARAHACTDILVPRVTDGLLPSMGAANDNGDRMVPDGTAVGGEDDEDSVDWEDGWEHNEDNPRITKTETTKVFHAMAVEHTLAAMKSAGGLQGGELEINFAQQQQTELVPNEQAYSESLDLSRRRLQKVAHILEQRHLPRLSSWVDCLTQADGLVEVPEEQHKAAVAPTLALISMPPSQIERRKEVLRRMQDLKREVASVLSSAKRLGLMDSCGESAEIGETASSVAASRRRSAATTKRTSTLRSRNQSLEVNLSRQRVARAPNAIAHKRNRIQIKYRKD